MWGGKSLLFNSTGSWQKGGGSPTKREPSGIGSSHQGLEGTSFAAPVTIKETCIEAQEASWDMG